MKGLLDPHTAIGVSVATDDSKHDISKELMVSPHPVVCLACAHWAKFPRVLKQAQALNVKNAQELEHDQNLVPQVLKNLASMPQRVDTLDNDKNIIREFVRSNLQDRSGSSSGRFALFGVAAVVG